MIKRSVAGVVTGDGQAQDARARSTGSVNRFTKVYAAALLRQSHAGTDVSLGPPLVARVERAETMSTVDAVELRRWCLAQTGAVEGFPFGPETSVFKVGGKVFAISALGRTPLEVSVKCEPELALDLRASYTAIRPG